jgi:uncharacterized membrane protein required for colicin V production
MNQVDLLIFVVIAASALSGAKRGLISSAGDIVALFLGLVFGTLCYPLFAAPLHWLTGLPEAYAGALGFMVAAVVVVFLAGWGFSHISERQQLEKKLNRTGGGLFGALFGVFFAAILVMASGLLPHANGSVKDSLLAPRIISLVPKLHQSLESVGLPLPKLVQLPTDYQEELAGLNQGRQFLRINFTALDGSQCINCGAKVDFAGYQFSRGTLMSPKFVCPKCGRTSDGCQTYEGFHTIYHGCPAEIAQDGVKFDCGVWTNGWWVVPRGTCPVCGKQYLPLRTNNP